MPTVSKFLSRYRYVGLKKKIKVLLLKLFSTMFSSDLPRKNNKIELQNRARVIGVNDNKLYIKDHEDKYRLGVAKYVADSESKEYVLMRSGKRVDDHHFTYNKGVKNNSKGTRKESNFGNLVNDKENFAVIENISEADVIKKRGGKAAYMMQKQEEENKNIDDLIQLSQTKSILIPPKEPTDIINNNNNKTIITNNDRHHNTISDITMNIIKSSYIQNISVIEKLYNEKLTMENRIKLLEDILLHSQTKGHDVRIHSIVDKIYHNSDHFKGESLDEYFSSQDYSSNSKANEGGLTAKDAALQLFALENDSNSLSADVRVLNASDVPNDKIVVKNGTKGITSKSLSANLLADQDKYLMKRRLLDELERKKKVDDELNEKERIRKQKYLASHGKEFTNVIKRQEEAQRKRKEKLDEVAKQEENKEKEEAKQRREKLKSSKNSQIFVVESWAEMVEKQNMLRRQRADARKQEMLSLMREPSCASAPAKKYRARPTTKITVRESPEEVMERLAMEHEAWKVKIETARTKAEKKVSLSHSSFDGVSAMEQREQILKSRRDARIKRQQLDSQKKELQKKKEALLASEKLFSQPVPPASRRLTRSAEVRSRSIWDKVGNQAQLNPAGLRDQENSKSVKINTSMSDEIIKTRVEIAKNSYKQNLMANKKRINESLIARPTLIDRHNAATAILDGKQSALAILNDLVKTTMNRNKVNMQMYSSDEEEQSYKKAGDGNDYRIRKYSGDYDEYKSNRK